MSVQEMDSEEAVDTTIADDQADQQVMPLADLLDGENTPPVITSNGGGDVAFVSMFENTTSVTTVAATDADPGQTPIFSITGGADAALFVINASSGALSFISAPNYETPSDADGDKIYDVIIQASDGLATDSQAIAVAIQDVRVEKTGNDYNITGGPGDDILDGGDGEDGVVYRAEGGSQGVIVNLSSSTLLANIGNGPVTVAGGHAKDTFGRTDTLLNIEEATGTAKADYFLAGDPDHSYRGLRGLAGNDTYNSGGGDTWVYYSAESGSGGTAGAIVNLSDADIVVGDVTIAAGTARDGFGDTDTFIGIHKIRGSNSADYMVGTSQDDHFQPAGGNDQLDGGDGFDLIDYGRDGDEGANPTAPITVDLLAGTATDGFGNTDTLRNFEAARGGYGNDTLRGDNNDNEFVGYSGNDFIDGRGGRDTVRYDIENSVRTDPSELSGVIVNLSGSALVLDIGNGPITVASGTARDNFGDTDTLVSIERVVGSQYADLIVGLDAASGVDFVELLGRGGDDIMIGGSAGSVISAGRGNDAIDGGDGYDTVLHWEEDGDAGSAVSVVTSGAGSGTILDPWGGTDNYANVEEIKGTQLNDSFVAGAGAQASDGWYVHWVGLAGNDTFDNSAGGRVLVKYDSEKYDHDDEDDVQGVVVNLSAVEQSHAGGTIAAGTATDTFGQTDILIGITAAEGTDKADALFASNQDSYLQGRAGDDLIQGGSGHDDLIGGDGDDVIFGVNGLSDGADYMEGGNGDDTFHARDDVDGVGDFVMAGMGNNTVIGIEVFNQFGLDGHDLSFQDLQVGVTASLTAGLATAAGMNTTFSAVHFLYGSGKADVLSGGLAAHDNFEGFSGMAGNDQIDGGTGRDMVDYRFETTDGYYDLDGSRVRGTQGVVVDLDSGLAIDSFGDIDHLISIEVVRGTMFADTVFGSNTAGDSFEGNQGDDIFDGRGGSDTIDYDADHRDGATSGVTVNLASEIATDSFGDTDTLISVERVRGSVFDDFIVGSSAANVLHGNAGNDALSGVGGDDLLEGGSGDDWIEGGDGVDMAAFQGNRSDYSIAMDADGTLTVTDQRSGGGDGIDTLLNVEILQFADGAVEVAALPFAPTITSNGGGATASVAIAENTAAITTVTAIDPDAGAAVTYSIAGGADASRFTIDPASGALSFIAAPDFETPTDSDGNNIYEVIVRADDGTLADTQAISVSVANDTELPTGVSVILAPVVEDSAARLITQAQLLANAGGGAGLAAENLLLASGKGVLTDNGDGTWSYRPLHNDDSAVTFNYEITGGSGTPLAANASIEITPLNDAPLLHAGGALEIVIGNDQTAQVLNIGADGSVSNSGVTLVAGGIVYGVGTGDVDGDGDLDILASGDSGPGRLYLNGGQGSFANSGVQFPGSFQIQNALVDIDNDGDLDALFNNGTGDLVIYANSGSTSFSQSQIIDPGTDSVSHLYSAGTGFAAADFNGDGFVDLYVARGDGSTTTQPSAMLLFNDKSGHMVDSGHILPAEYVRTAAVGDIDNDGDVDVVYAGRLSNGGSPGNGGVLLNDGTGQFSEYQTSFGPEDVYAIKLGDYDGDGAQDAVVGSNTGLQLWHNDGTGHLSLDRTIASGVVLDNLLVDLDEDGDTDVVFITRSGATTTIASLVNDGAGNFTSSGAALALAGNGVSSMAGGNLLPGDPSGATAAIAEIIDAGPGENSVVHQTSGFFGISDVDAADTHTVSASPQETGYRGTLNAEIVSEPGLAHGTVKWTFSVADADLDDLAMGQVQQQTYVLTIDDGNGGTATTSVTISLTGQNDAPHITSDGGSDTVTLNIVENASAVTTVTAADPDTGATVTFSIVGGDDANRFAIDPSSGALSFITPPDYEAAADADADNVYQVTVQASDGSISDVQAISVTVGNGNEAPNITSGTAVTTGENGPAVTTATATDPDGGTAIIWSIAGGADAAKFSINAATGLLTFVAAPNYEAPDDAGGNNIYDVILEASDGALADRQSISVTVSDVNDAASAIVASNQVGIVETTTTRVKVADVAVLDPDLDPGFRNNLVVVSDSRFEIDATDGALYLKAGQTLSHDGEPSINLVLTARDGSLVFALPLVVTVLDSNAPPTGAPAINDQTPTEGQQLTAGLGTMADANGLPPLNQLAWQWQVNNGAGFTNIAGATAPSFTPVQAQVGMPIRVVATFTDLGGTLETLVSAQSIVVGDFYNGNGSSNIFVGTGGDDIALGQGGNDTLSGNDGDDQLDGGNGNDGINGGNGNDLISGGAGADTLNGDDGNDQIDGGAANDIITGGAGADVLLGGLGKDIVNGGADNDQIDGGDDNDTLNGDDGDDTVVGGAGNDMLAGGAGADRLLGGLGNDTYLVDDPSETIVEAANEGTDTVQTTLHAYALAANVENLVKSGAGDFVGTGNDLANVITGGSTDDTLSGGAGNDTLNGGGGNDLLDGGQGDDRLVGGAGDDTYVVGSDSDVVVERAGEGTDSVSASVSASLSGNVENLLLTGNGDLNAIGNGLANRIIGNTGSNYLDGAGGDDAIFGNDGDDTIDGDAGNDVVDGGSGNDAIDGGNGIDTIIGGLGDDVLRGGGGDDRFIFNPAFGNDRIIAFDSNPSNGQDYLDISGLGITAQTFSDDVLVQQVGADSVITLDEGTITLINTKATTVTQADFQL